MWKTRVRSGVERVEDYLTVNADDFSHSGGWLLRSTMSVDVEITSKSVAEVLDVVWEGVVGKCWTKHRGNRGLLIERLRLCAVAWARVGPA
jgi:hypothetical protein